MTFTYVQVPLLLNYQFSKGVNFGLGPYVGYLLKAKNDSSIFVSYKDSSNFPTSIAKSSSGSGSLDIVNAMNKLDIGAAFSFGYESDGGLGFQLRYAYGFTKAFMSNTYIDPATKVAKFQPAYGNNTTISFSIYKLF